MELIQILKANNGFYKICGLRGMIFHVGISQNRFSPLDTEKTTHKDCYQASLWFKRKMRVRGEAETM